MNACCTNHMDQTVVFVCRIDSPPRRIGGRSGNALPVSVSFHWAIFTNCSLCELSVSRWIQIQSSVGWAQKWLVYFLISNKFEIPRFLSINFCVERLKIFTRYQTTKNSVWNKLVHFELPIWPTEKTSVPLTRATLKLSHQNSLNFPNFLR